MRLLTDTTGIFTRAKSCFAALLLAAASPLCAQTDILPAAPEADACGRERYALHSRDFVGAVVDLEETYRWGQEELARITAQMQPIAANWRDFDATTARNAAAAYAELEWE